MSVKVVEIPAFTDNYIWLIRADNDMAVVVDPGDAVPVLSYLKQHDLQLTGILITHHHSDHTGGISSLLAEFPHIAVYGPATENISFLTHRVEEGDRVSFPEVPVSFDVLNVFGHTAGHIAYVSEKRLFCGDTLFACGCGRVFDGTLEGLSNSLSKIAMLAKDTKVYCAHEYTLDNIGFARWVEPDNADLIQREKDTHQLLSDGKASVPSLLSLELLTNPFLRLKEKTVIHKAEKFTGRTGLTDTEVFSAIRTWKDTEYD